MNVQGRGLPTFLIGGLAAFMAALDNLVVTTALPTIRADLNTGLEGLEWTVNAYTLAFAVFLMTAAILGDRFGRKRVFMSGIALFTVASAAAAMSTSTGMLVAARAVQGLGGSVIFPLSLTLLVTAVAPARRGMAIAGLSGMGGLAIALGPLVGGLVVELGSWQWIFWLNVPIGLLLIPAAARWLRESHGPNDRLDVRGTALITGGLLGLVFGLVRGNTLGWGDPLIVASIAIGVVLIVAFVIWENRTDIAVLPPHLFRSRGFTLSSLVALLVQGGMFGAVFLLTQFLQEVMGYSPLEAGLRTLPWTLMPAAVAPAAAILADRIGVRAAMILSVALQGGALFWMALVVSPTVQYVSLLPGMLIAGVGMGLFFALTARQTLDFVRTAEHGIASGINNAMRQIGVVLGIATLAAVFASIGGYGVAQDFVGGLRPALLIGALALVVAIVAELCTPPGPASDPTHESPVGPDVAVEPAR